METTSVFLPGTSHAQRSLGATVHRVTKSQETTERPSTSLIYNVVLVSGVQQSDSVMFFQIIFCYMLLHVIEHSSLYYIKVKVKLLSHV